MMKATGRSVISIAVTLCLLQTGNPAQAASIQYPIFNSAPFAEMAIVTRLIDFKFDSQDHLSSLAPSQLAHRMGIMHEPIEQTVQSFGVDPERFVRKAGKAGFLNPEALRSPQAGLIRLYTGSNNRYLLNQDEEKPYEETLRTIKRSFFEHEKKRLSGVVLHVTRSPHSVKIDDWSLSTTVMQQNVLHVYIHVNLLHAIQSFNPAIGVPHARETAEKLVTLVAPELKNSHLLNVQALADALAEHELMGASFLDRHRGASDTMFHRSLALPEYSDYRQSQLALTVVGMASVSEGDAFLHDPRQDTQFERFKNVLMPVVERVLLEIPGASEELKQRIRGLFSEPEHSFEYPIVYHADSDFYAVYMGNRVIYSTANGPAKGGLRYADDDSPNKSGMLSARMTLKDADNEHGGGKGGVRMHPATLSLLERVMGVSPGWLLGGVAVAGPCFIDVNVDIPATDIGSESEDTVAILDAHLRFLFDHHLMSPEFQEGIEQRREKIDRIYAEKTIVDGERVFYRDPVEDKWYRADELKNFNKKNGKKEIRDRMETWVVPESEDAPRNSNRMHHYRSLKRDAVLAAPMLEACLEIKKLYDAQHPEEPLKAAILGSITGKPAHLGGSNVRDDATGGGGAIVVDLLRDYLYAHPDMAKRFPRLAALIQKKKSDITVAIQGQGKAGFPASVTLFEMGYRIVHLSDLDFGFGTLVNPQGIDIKALQKHLVAQKGNNFESFAREEGGGIFLEDPVAVLRLPVDILIPAAKEDVIVAANADPKLGQVNADEVEAAIVGELANGPVADPKNGETRTAAQILIDKGILLVPGEFFNSGGVKVSIYEKIQNMLGEHWSSKRVWETLKAALAETFRALIDTANTEFDLLHLRDAYTLWAVRRVVAAMVERLRKPAVNSLYDKLEDHPAEMDRGLNHVFTFQDREFTFHSLALDLGVPTVLASRILHWLYSYGILKLLTRRNAGGAIQKVYVVSDAIRWILALRGSAVSSLPASGRALLNVSA